MPFVRPEIVTGEEEPVPPITLVPSVAEAPYPVIGSSPTSEGAVNATDTCPEPAVAAPIVGASGTLRLS